MNKKVKKLVIMDERALVNPDDAQILSAWANNPTLEEVIAERDEDFPHCPIVDPDTWEVVA